MTFGIKYITSKEWPGPESPGCEAMVLRHEEAISQLSGQRNREPFERRIKCRVIAMGDPEGDPWDLNSTMIWIKAWIIELSIEHEWLKVAVPTWLKWESEIIEKGSWPVGYTDMEMNVMMVVKTWPAQQVDSAEASTIAVPPSAPSGSPR